MQKKDENNKCDYPTALRRVQITPKMSTNITPEDRLDRLDRFYRNAQAMIWIEVTKKTIWCFIADYFYPLFVF